MTSVDPKIPSSTQSNALPLSVTFWGVRGSAPICDAGYQVFGGNTTCLEVNTDQSSLIIDAGSGMRQLGIKLLKNNTRRIDIVLSHYHMDHLIGLMTFAPLFNKDVDITIHAPILDDINPETTLRNLLGAPFFPMEMKDAGAAISIHSFHPGETITLDNLNIQTLRLAHPGGACGYRLDCGTKSIAVITDYEHASNLPDPSLVSFCSGADIMLYDAHWDEDIDYTSHAGWGHSTWQAGLRLMLEARIKHLGCVHHAPSATDIILKKREKQMQKRHPTSFIAREGSTKHL